MSTAKQTTTAVDLTTATALGAALGDAKVAGVDSKQAYCVVPEGYKLEDLEKFQNAPARIRKTALLGSVQSFADYVKRFADANTVLFYDDRQPLLQAVLDYHQKDSPNWNSHVAEFKFNTTSTWDTWLAANKKQMNQAEFAQFIEDNLVDIIRPSSADMLAISRTLEAKKDVNFASAIRLSNGEMQFTYSENIQGTAQNGKLEIPEEFILGMAVFEGATPYELRARFRYRIGPGGQLSIWYDLYRAKDFKDLAAKAFIQQTLEALKDVAAFRVAK